MAVRSHSERSVPPRAASMASASGSLNRVDIGTRLPSGLLGLATCLSIPVCKNVSVTNATMNPRGLADGGVLPAKEH